ncbi:MAG: DUF1320 domain-containing protein [Clostridiaceae bacterium]|nr:DUF1320 domain-containing protein [Clostridiaceae bacterium]
MYCTVEDLLKQVSRDMLIMLTDDEGDGEIQEGNAQKAIADASNEINAYCQTRYTTPFNPVPGILNKVAVDIALYNLFSRRGFDEDSADVSIVHRYKNAVKILEGISKGTVTLGQPTPTPEREIKVKSNRKIFSRDKMRGF